MKLNKKQLNFDIAKFRNSLSLTQSEMAKRMGLGSRSYQDLEADPNKIQSRHIRLAESVALDLAVERRDPMLIPASIRAKVLTLATGLGKTVSPIQELFSIAERLAALKDTLLSKSVREHVDAILAACEKIGKSWSGSNLGYHATVYYVGLATPPAGAHFSSEWGIQERWPIQDTRGDWEEYKFEDVTNAIFAVADVPDLMAEESLADETRKEFETLKTDIISILTAWSADHKDNFIGKKLAEVPNIKSFDANQIGRAVLPKGQFMSRDSLAVTQGIRVAPHQHIAAKALAIRSVADANEKLERVAREVASHLKRLEGRERQDKLVGTNVFIGHGRSLLWRELKDFVRDRLGLPIDEFNRVPVAGITNIARLSEMLGAASVALLVLTAEDEHVDGKLNARQNVVHEVGLFQGRLGFTKAIVLLEEECEAFSNIHGLGQIRFPKGNIKAAFEEVRQVLEREGLISV
jgi:predicted nucleotide-binding protein/DNA-binding XRE family transcriptional regulator